MKKLILFLLLFSQISLVFSQELSKIKFEYITVDDGLAQGIVEEIFQDSQGFIWFGTHDGLTRYDGIQFTVFKNDRNDPQSLVSNWVFSMAEDKSGKLWIGSEGLNWYDPESGKITRIIPEPGNENAFQGGRVYHINIDYDSTVWISTLNGLVHYFPKTNMYKTYRDGSNSNGLSSSGVFSTCITNDKRLFVSVNNDVIHEYNRTSDSFTAISYRLAYHGNNNNKYIREDLNGLLYITSEFSGLHIYNPNTGETKFIDKAEGGLNTNNIRTPILPLNKNEVWIGTDGGGVNVYNPLSGEMQYIVSDSRAKNSLAGNAIIRMFEDKDGNVWIGHYGTGISVWKKNKEKFVSFTHNPFNAESINKEVVSAIYEDAMGRIWIGQDGGGLSLFNPVSGTFEHFRSKPGTPGTLTSDVILAIIEDDNGNLLLGTYAGGLMVFDPETKKVIRSFNTSTGLASDHVWTFFRDSKNRFWFTDLRSGYCLFDPVNETFESHPQGNDPLSPCSNSLMTINEDAEGRLWLGSENGGISVIDYDNQTNKTYRNNPDDPNSLSYNDVKSIIFIGHYAWIATNGGGLNRLDLKTDSFRVFGTQNGLSSEALMGLLKDKHNNLWISSTKGLMKFNTETFDVEIFDKSQGIQGNEFKYNSQFILSDGRMMFGGVNGITIFHPDSIRKSRIVPGVAFTDLSILNESIVPAPKGSVLKKHINSTAFIKLNHKQSVFTIEFVSLDYNAPEKNHYRYKLEGFDKHWIDAGNKRSATYTNLDPGRYTFILMGSNSDGVWNETPRTIEIRVKPPWYKSILSFIIYLIAAISALVYYIKQREKSAVQTKLILEQKIKEAQAELIAKTKMVEDHEAEIKRRDEEEKDIRFYTDGIALMSDIIAKKRQNIEELSTSVISELVRYVDASAGGIFVMDDADPEQLMLRATGEFCLSSDAHANYSFAVGEGNIGTCYKEKQTLVYDNLPEGYIIMRSGLGNISLRHAIYLPIMQDNVCVGVIEVASVEKLSENKVKFCEKIAESLASIILIIKANEKSSQMIEQNNAQAEELRAQEEEMRQNMEELLATQEESQRREQSLVRELEEARAKIKALQKKE